MTRQNQADLYCHVKILNNVPYYEPAEMHIQKLNVCVYLFMESGISYIFPQCENYFQVWRLKCANAEMITYFTDVK